MQLHNPHLFQVVLKPDSLLVNGEKVQFPTLEKDVLALLGAPDRILQGNPPAPAGHRNNEVYVYDDLGVYWIRQHDSNQMLSLTLVFGQSEGPLKIPFLPKSAFSGPLELPTLSVTSETAVGALRKWLGYIGPYHLSFIAGRERSVDVKDGDGKLASISIGLGNLRTRPAEPSEVAVRGPASHRLRRSGVTGSDAH